MRRRSLLTPALLVTVAGCMTVQAVPAPRQYIQAERPSRIWVTHEEDLVEVTGPRLIGDTLAGFFGGEYREVPIPVFGPVYAERLDRTRTSLLIGGVAASIGLASLALWGGGEGDLDIPDPEEPGQSRVPLMGRVALLIPLLRLSW